MAIRQLGFSKHGGARINPYEVGQIADGLTKAYGATPEGRKREVEFSVSREGLNMVYVEADIGNDFIVAAMKKLGYVQFND